ncbi:hypothetical protein F5884DRAFT_793425 [Xylogone sp. PMI_703]|nr:hypothetical protein F5884DRAFT_793425 [Xylogone sp. PMI_703]
MMGFTKIAVVGGTGQLGQHILRHLHAHTSPKFDITVLGRSDIGSRIFQLQTEWNEIRLKKVDYDNQEMLVEALQGIEVIVSTLDSVPATRIDPLLLEAGKKAGVRRIFPSEYTLDVLHPAAVNLMGESHPRVQHARRFASLEESDTISSTTIVSGMFIDFAMRGHHGNYDPKSRKATLFDGGDVPATGCSSDFIAASVIAALQMSERETKNKRIHIAEAKYTGRQILEALESAAEIEYTVTQVPAVGIRKKLELAKEQGPVRETFVLPVVLLNFAAVDEHNNPYGAGLLEDGLQWNAGGFLHQKRKSLVEIAKETVECLSDAICL